MYMYLYSLAFMDHPCTLGVALCHKTPSCPLYTQLRVRRVWARRTSGLKIVSTQAGFEPTISRLKVACANHWATQPTTRFDISSKNYIKKNKINFKNDCRLFNINLFSFFFFFFSFDTHKHIVFIRTVGWSGGAKVSCILHHRGVQLILAYSWARPAILVAGKGRWGIFLFLLFLHFHSCSFLPCPSL